ncbi:MAG: 1-deoxy-D-xylulose-5-phosphate reductoisomerase [Pseudomonadales bacterium]
MSAKWLTLLGSTGSIGQSTLEVIAQRSDYQIYALTAHQNMELLFDQCQRFRPRYAVLGSKLLAESLALRLDAHGLQTSVLFGEQALVDVASDSDVTHVMAAIVGGAGLGSSFAAANNGKTVFLANKEALVMAGSLLMDAVDRSGATLLPVDSEHNAIFQCLGQSSEVGREVRRILLTGSGGPFLERSLSELEHVTPAEACRHPNWVMGQKISIDSATMMNKGLELIEACWLFDVAPQKIEFVIHPQSIVHSMVEFQDASVIAQLGQPDMKTPIAHVLAFPDRMEAGVSGLDFSQLSALEFRSPDFAQFPLLALARTVAEGHQSLAIAFNAANEVAVDAFLAEEIPFLGIQRIIATVVAQAPQPELNTIEDVLTLDRVCRTMAEGALHIDG